MGRKRILKFGFCAKGLTEDQEAVVQERLGSLLTDLDGMTDDLSWGTNKLGALKPYLPEWVRAKWMTVERAMGVLQ